MTDILTPEGLQARVFSAQFAQKRIGCRCSAHNVHILPIFAILSFVVMLSPSPVSADPLLGDDAASIPIFDVHVHYNEPAWQSFPPETVINIFDQNKVALALVSSSPDDGTLALWEHSPERIISELGPYHGDWTNLNWMSNDGMADYLSDRLAERDYAGIGEFHVSAVDGADLELLGVIARGAEARGIPIHIHSGAEPVRYFFEVAPEITVIWAHAGIPAPPFVVRPAQPAEIGAMMDSYPRLYADTSLRTPFILSEDGIDPAWEELLIRHADRFMVGSDTFRNSQWDFYGSIIEGSRSWLALLPKTVAEKIANGNASALFGRAISD